MGPWQIPQSVRGKVPQDGGTVRNVIVKILAKIGFGLEPLAGLPAGVSRMAGHLAAQQALRHPHFGSAGPSRMAVTSGKLNALEPPS